MPGERLMCVWKAVIARDISPESGVKKATVKSVTESFVHSKLVTYQEARFEEIFTMSKVCPYYLFGIAVLYWNSINI